MEGELNMGVKTESVAIKVTAEEKELIKRIAAEQDITVSKLLYRIIKQALTEQ